MRSSLLGTLLALTQGHAVATADRDADTPAAVPSGMDLLYGDRIALTETGEPVVAVGLMTGQRRFEVTASAQVQVDFYEAGAHRRVFVPRGSRVTLGLVRSRSAKRRHYLDLEGVHGGGSEAVAEALAGWRGRGFAEVEAQAEGTVLGIAGRVIDNREVRIVLPATSRRDASRRADALYERFGTRAVPRARLLERPWAEMLVRVDGARLGLATSYVRFVPQGKGQLEVHGVEFGKGYDWHGRENRSYRGQLYVTVDAQGALAAVNVVPAEILLEGVVPSEIFASAHPEALKAQAVAARNIMLAQLGRRHHDAPFHLCSSQHCQVYTGVAREDPRTSAAVRATHGQALFLKDRLVSTAYSSTCGGHTEDNDVVWPDPADPALRGRPDFDVAEQPGLARFADGVGDDAIEAWVTLRPRAYCAQASQGRADKFRWQHRIEEPELSARLGKRLPRLGKLVGVEVEGRGPGGRIAGLRLVGTRDEVSVLRELPIRRLFGNLRSAAATVEVARDARGTVQALTFSGAGWGHGVGLCQLGAIGRAEAGHTYHQILAHYYGGAAVRRLYRDDQGSPALAGGLAKTP